MPATVTFVVRRTSIYSNSYHQTVLCNNNNKKTIYCKRGILLQQNCALHWVAVSDSLPFPKDMISDMIMWNRIIQQLSCDRSRCCYIKKKLWFTFFYTNLFSLIPYSNLNSGRIWLFPTGRRVLNQVGDYYNIIILYYLRTDFYFYYKQTKQLVQDNKEES